MTIAVVSDEGTVTITDAALNQIVVQAAEAAAGARVRRRRQLEIAIADTGARVQLELAVPYGQVLPDVARDVQERVASALGTMCGVNVTAVDVTIEELS
jgi:uncharacterized alkaline shock family protein YloU